MYKYQECCDEDCIVKYLLEHRPKTVYSLLSINETIIHIRESHSDKADYLPPNVREQTLIDRHKQMHSDIVNVNINKYGKIKNFSKNI